MQCVEASKDKYLKFKSTLLNNKVWNGHGMTTKLTDDVSFALNISVDVLQLRVVLNYARTLDGNGKSTKCARKGTE